VGGGVVGVVRHRVVRAVRVVGGVARVCDPQIPLSTEEVDVVVESHDRIPFDDESAKWRFRQVWNSHRVQASGGTPWLGETLRGICGAAMGTHRGRRRVRMPKASGPLNVARQRTTTASTSRAESTRYSSAPN